MREGTVTHLGLIVVSRFANSGDRRIICNPEMGCAGRPRDPHPLPQHLTQRLLCGW